MRTLLVVLMVLTFYPSSFSQDTSFIPKYALSFGIKDNFTLSSFNMDIAMKKIFEDSNQLRLFVSPRITTLNQDSNVEGTGQSQEIETRNYSLGIGADYLWTLMVQDDFRLFGGPGLILSYSKRQNKNYTSMNDSTNNTNETSAVTTDAGLRGILGVEWKVSEKIGIHCEYIVTGSYYWEQSDQKIFINGVQDIAIKKTGTGIYLSSNVLFGLSIYF